MSCDFYNHASSVFDDTAWTVWQYHDNETQSGTVIAFRRSNSPFDNVKISLKGLEADKRYRIINLDNGTAEEISDMLNIVLPEKRSSVVFEYKMK